MIAKKDGTYGNVTIESGDKDFDKANEGQLKVDGMELVAAINKLGVADQLFAAVLKERKRQQEDLISKLS